jgi:acetylornithine deacetylase/succinyl-diaminopimelate desuccinylase-like protein
MDILKNKENQISLFLIILCTFTIMLSVVKKNDRKITSLNDSSEACANAIWEIQPESLKSFTFSSSVNLKITEAFKICLSSYIQIKTISPRGDEHLAVDFFENIFTRLNIAHKRYSVPDLNSESTKSRMNLVATLPTSRASEFDWSATPQNKSIILLNHMDVVDANPSQWEDPAYAWSGKIAPSKTNPEELFIWGRGALDMKGIAITQLINLWILKQLDLPLKRDIHFVAVADEEGAGSGAIGTLKKMQGGEELHALSGANLVLNEGGGAIRDVPAKGSDLFLLATEEKGGAWLNFKHKDAIILLKDLYRSKMMQIDNRISKKDPKILGHECSLIKILTPQAKVNVVASKVILELKCKEGFQTTYLFENLFKHNFKTVSTKAIQKGRITTLTIETSSASHGSTGINESAIDAMIMGLYHLNILDIKKDKSRPSYFEYVQTEATSTLINSLKQSNFMLSLINRLGWIPFIKRLILKEVENSFGLDGLFRTTCQFSALNYDATKNTNAEALVDCRLLHTALKNKKSQDHAQDFIDQVYKRINDSDLNIELISGWNVSQSSVQNKDFKTIVSVLNKIQREDNGKKSKSIASAYLFPAGTDSTWFRNPSTAGVNTLEPIPAYGFFPLYMTEELLASYHGSNERFPVKEIAGTVEKYFAVLKELASSKGESFFKNLSLGKKKKIKLKVEEDEPIILKPKLLEDMQQHYQDQITIE